MSYELEKLKSDSLRDLEDKQLLTITEKIDLYNKEFELKKKLGIKPINPEFEYEKTKEYQDFLVQVAGNSIDIEILNLETTVANISNQRLVREDALKDLKKREEIVEAQRKERLEQEAKEIK